MNNDKASQKICSFLQAACGKDIINDEVARFEGEKYSVVLSAYKPCADGYGVFRFVPAPRLEAEILIRGDDDQWHPLHTFVGGINAASLPEIHAQIGQAVEYLQKYCELDTEEGRWWFKQPKYKQGEARWIKHLSGSDWVPAVFMDGYFYFHDLDREPDDLFRIGDRIDPPKED